MKNSQRFAPLVCKLLNHVLPPPLDVQRVRQFTLDVLHKLLALHVLHVVDGACHVHRGRGHLFTETVQATHDPVERE